MKRIILAVVLVLSIAAAQTTFASEHRTPATSYTTGPTPTPIAGIQKHG